MTDILCDDVVCRAREDREDIACQRSAGHDGEHIHTLALGWCLRPAQAGPGHVPYTVRDLLARSGLTSEQASALYEEARLEGLRQAEAGEIESRITVHVGAMREDYE